MGTALVRRLLAPASAVVVVSCLTAGPAMATTGSTVFAGSAYGSTAQVGTTVRSGETSLVSACNIAGYRHTDHAAAVNLGGVGSIGAVDTLVQGAVTRGNPAETSTSATGATSLLGGLVQAKAITTRATASHDTAGYHLTGSTTIVGLKISGLPVTVTSKPNQQIVIPGVATVALNVQGTSNNYDLHQSVVTGMRVTLLSGNRLGLPAGVVTVGRSVAALHGAVHARPYGSAYATKVNLANTITSGATAPIYLPCGGSAGKTLTNSTAAIRLGDVVSTGALSSSAVSTDSATAATAVTKAKVANINLLHGVVSADAVTSQANATLRNKTLVRNSTGTTITGLKINGKKIVVNAKVTSTINIAGVGTLYLNRTVNSGSQIEVHALQLHLTTARAGLKAGADVDIAVARAGITTN